MSMERFWKEVNDLLAEKDVMIETSTGKVNKLLYLGYIEIEANNLIFRSIPDEHGIMWVCWEPFHVLGHFSQISDECATVKWKNINE